MKHLKYLFMVFAGATIFASCEKHVITYEAETIPAGSAEFQLHYFVPLVANTSNNIYKVDINNQTYSLTNAPLAVYNAVPSGAVSRFFNAPAGNTNIKLYRTTAHELIYDQNTTLLPGKQNVFVYDNNQPPIVIDNKFPYPRNVAEYTDSSGWVRFYNFLFDTINVPTTKRLQYQYQYTMDRTTLEKSEWMNVGEPVAFGEATDWVELPVVPEITTAPSASYARVDYRIIVVGADGSNQGLLRVRNATGATIDYADWWTLYVGRHYMHILGGHQTATPISSVRQFTAN